MDEKSKEPTSPATSASEEFFDESFRDELEQLAGLKQPRSGTGAVSLTLNQKLLSFLTLPGPEGKVMLEDDFAQLSDAQLTERVNALLELCRQGTKPEAVQAADNFVVFFRALIPTLHDEGSQGIKRVFFRLVPTLLQIAYRDFSRDPGKRKEGIQVLRKLEKILIEISHVRLAPTESELVFRSIDQITNLCGAGEFTMADETIAANLLSIITRNKVMRALYRIMEVETELQRYLQDKLGYASPRIRIPEDLEALTEYGPLSVFQEQAADGSHRAFIQVHLPEIPDLKDVVLHLSSEPGERSYTLRFDALGSTELTVPDGAYSLGLAYSPPDDGRAVQPSHIL